MNSGRSKETTLLLCIFFGYLGFHRYYVGKMGTGFKKPPSPAHTEQKRA